MKPRYILGISAFYHDSAVALIYGSEVVFAAQEERFTRIKHDSSFPSNAAAFCLSAAGIGPEDISDVVFYEKPLPKFERLLETYLAFAPRGFGSFRLAMPLWIKEKLFQKTLIVRELEKVFGKNINWKNRLKFSEHHLSHAASAFFPSPFENAAVITLDGVGEWATTSVAIGNGADISTIREIHFPHSIGLLYSAFTYYCGFRVNSGEYKLMGLAPYGEPEYADLILENLVRQFEDGSFLLDMSYFDFATGLTMTSEKFHTLFGGRPRYPDEELTQRDMNLAASIQAVTEQIVLNLARSVARETGQTNLCLAGGVALNCVVNGILLKEEVFENIWIQPAAGDAGGALGAALALWHLHYRGVRQVHHSLDSMNGAYLGPEFDDDEAELELLGVGATFHKMSEAELLSRVAEDLAEGKAVGWMQGKMEFGPRALGGRSILGDPRSEQMQATLNLKVKYRESFRPFAPSVLREQLSAWFDLAVDSPYMLLVANVERGQQIEMTADQQRLFGIEKLNVPRSSVPAVTHVDYSARVQTVHSETNPKYHALLTEFSKITGCPLLVNTSFNVRGEPIVCSPLDAYRCFMGTELDSLAIGNLYLDKNEQKKELSDDYRTRFELD